ncbi:MAG: hypothetical protein ACRDF4_03410 [Rhabdochlamydiaceae bacterium]
MTSYTLICDETGAVIGTHVYGGDLPTSLPANEIICTQEQSKMSVLWRNLEGTLTPAALPTVVLNGNKINIGKQLRDSLHLLVVSNLTHFLSVTSLTNNPIPTFTLNDPLTKEAFSFPAGSVTIQELLSAFRTCIAQVGLS